VSRARRSTSASNGCVNRERVRAHGTCSTRTPQWRHRTRRTTARTNVTAFQQSRCRHSRAGLMSWMRFLVSPQPEQIADPRGGSSWMIIRRVSSRVTPITRQPLAGNSCSVRMPRSTPPIRFCVCTPQDGPDGVLPHHCSFGDLFGEAGSLTVASSLMLRWSGPGRPSDPIPSSQRRAQVVSRTGEARRPAARAERASFDTTEHAALCAGLLSRAACRLRPGREPLVGVAEADGPHGGSGQRPVGAALNPRRRMQSTLLFTCTISAILHHPNARRSKNLLIRV